MSRWFPVRASSLRTRCVETDSQTFEQATLFPFFDGYGDTKFMMIVDHQSPVLHVFHPDDVRTVIPLFGRIRVEGLISRLDDELLALIAPLWHFDPWWLLKDERYAFESSIPTLKHTNCVTSFSESVEGMIFSRDARRVRWIYHGAESDHAMKSFRPSMLPATRPPLDEPCHPSGSERGWQLAPFWQP